MKWKKGQRIKAVGRAFAGTIAEVGNGYVLMVGDGKKHYEYLALRLSPTGRLTDDNGVRFVRERRRR